MRVGFEPAFRVGDADLPQQFNGLARGSLAVQPQVQAQHFGDLKADGEAGVQAGRGLLKNHGHVLAGELVALCVRQRQQVMAGKAQGVGAHPARVGHQAHQRHHGDTFAGARFTDDAKHFALFKRQADAVNGMHDAALRGELDRQVFYFKQGHI